jgi:hypothetical protein
MTEEKKLLQAQLKDAEKIAREARERLDSIERKEAAERLEPLKATAERAHDLLCPFNHTDGCPWGYEGNSWQSSAHARWLAKIDVIVNGGPYEKRKATIEELNVILDAVAALKPKVGTALSLLRRDLVA